MSADVLERLTEVGFIVVPGPIDTVALTAMAVAYDGMIASSDARHGSTSVRVNVSASRCFDVIPAWPLLAQAARRLVGPHFKLSSFHARSLRPSVPAENLHRDVQAEHDGWPLLGFIFMIDAFTATNGATRFVPNSQSTAIACEQNAVAACGAAGSTILFDGTLWHGHGANHTKHWRRSIQGALIPCDATSAIDHSNYVAVEDRDRLPTQLRRLMCL